MTLAELSIKRPIFVTCSVFLMIVAGLVSLSRLSVDLFPNITLPVVVVSTPYRGAGPAEIETLVTKPMEDELSTISGMKRITSNSIEGMSQVIAEFRLETDIKYAEQQVRDKASAVRFKLPRDADDPIIRRIDPADQPIIRLGLNADLPPAKLFEVADELIRTRLQQIDGVGLVEVTGGRKREIQVLLDQRKLREREMSVSMVVGRLSSAGENIPAGKMQKDDSETAYKTVGQFETLGDISESIVSFFGNESATQVSQVGVVKDTLEDERTRAFISGKPAIFVDVYKQSGANTVAVGDKVNKLVPKIQEQLTASVGGTISIIQDGAWPIRANLVDVVETIGIGIILTILVVYLFLASARSTFITALALPNSLIGAFLLMDLAGFTINVVSLLALVLAVGLLVDDAIVVRENIFRQLEKGVKPIQAAIQGTKEVTLAVIATTLVVIAVFGPVAFMAGIIGQFLKQFGLTVCFAMAISLFDALTIAPMLSAYFAGSPHKKTTGFGAALKRQTLGRFDRFQTWLEGAYERILHVVVRYPKSVMIVSFGIFVACMYTAKYVPKTFLPTKDDGQFSVAMDLPEGTNLAAMSRLAEEADAVVRQNPEVELTAMKVGGRNGEPNKADIYVKLVPASQRPKVRTTDVKQRVREQMQAFAQANPKVKDFDPVGGEMGSRPFALNILGDDPVQLQAHAEKVLAVAKADERLKDVDTSYRVGKPELQIRALNDRSQAYGVSTALMGQELRSQIEGATPAKFRELGREYDVRVRLQEDQRDLKQNFKSTLIPNVNQKLVPLRQFAEANEVIGPASINRQDRTRYVRISADLAPNASLGGIMSDYSKNLSEGELKLPAGMRYAYIGESENFQELGTSMLMAVGFAILFIYLVLASLYESFITPFTIMLALPLAVAGATVALLVAGESLNLFAILGIFMLIGVASKNSILLVDFAKMRMAEGQDRVSAIIEAGKTRLRPILMTSFTLLAGTLPLAIGLNEASKQRTSMGVGIIGGTISSTLLTLVVIPAAFIFIDRFRVWFEAKFRRPEDEGGGDQPDHRSDADFKRAG